jgi:hypothetical protein
MTGGLPSLRVLRPAWAPAALALLLAAQVRAAEPAPVDGWVVGRADEMSCMASAPNEADGASVSLVAQGPMFLMLVSAPDFPKEKRTYAAFLSFDGGAPMAATALGEDGVMGFVLNRTGPAKIVAGASRIAVNVEGHTHTLSLRNAGAALDAAARCAGAPTLSEQVETPPQPIPGAGGWTLIRNVAGLSQRACSARIRGPQIDTILLRNNDGQMVLMGGHPEWATWGAEVPLQLSIDGGPATALKAQSVDNLIAVLVEDPALAKRLRGAHAIEWTIPTGRVRGEVSGLGVAFDAVVACATGKG